MLRLIIKKLQRGLLSLATARGISYHNLHHHEDNELEVSTVPDDVKEGHFAVFAVQDGQRERFVVKLECLNSPAFSRLLEQAEEEFGFEQTGVLVVPCRPEELHKILTSAMRDGFYEQTTRSLCNLTMIKGY